MSPHRRGGGCGCSRSPSSIHPSPVVLDWRDWCQGWRGKSYASSICAVSLRLQLAQKLFAYTSFPAPTFSSFSLTAFNIVVIFPYPVPSGGPVDGNLSECAESREPPHVCVEEGCGRILASANSVGLKEKPLHTWQVLQFPI